MVTGGGESVAVAGATAAVLPHGVAYCGAGDRAAGRLNPIALRVGGSWIAVIGILMQGWLLQSTS